MKAQIMSTGVQVVGVRIAMTPSRHRGAEFHPSFNQTHFMQISSLIQEMYFLTKLTFSFQLYLIACERSGF